MQRVGRCARLVKHSTDGFFIVDAANRLRQQMRHGQLANFGAIFHFCTERNGVGDDQFIQAGVVQILLLEGLRIVVKSLFGFAQEAFCAR